MSERERDAYVADRVFDRYVEGRLSRMDALRLACEFIAITEQGCPTMFHWGEAQSERCKSCEDREKKQEQWIDCWGSYFEAKAKEESK
jgi:hypothetical protein